MEVEPKIGDYIAWENQKTGAYCEGEVVEVRKVPRTVVIKKGPLSKKWLGAWQGTINFPVPWSLALGYTQNQWVSAANATYVLLDWTDPNIQKVLNPQLQVDIDPHKDL